jgi:hypothetical protein
MASKAPYQTTFEVEHTIQPIYTGGSVTLEQNGRILATTLGEDALLTDLNTGRQLAKIEGVSRFLGQWKICLLISVQDGELISTMTRRLNQTTRTRRMANFSNSNTVCLSPHHMLALTIDADIFSHSLSNFRRRCQVRTPANAQAPHDSGRNSCRGSDKHAVGYRSCRWSS